MIIGQRSQRLQRVRVKSAGGVRGAETAKTCRTVMMATSQTSEVQSSTCAFLSAVLSSVDSLCAELLSNGTRGFDPSPAVTRAVTNVVCTLVFSSTYDHGDSELQEVIRYNNGIVETIAQGGLVDIFPWMKVQDRSEESWSPE